MVIYIHGFGSSGKGGKALEFRTYFENQGIVCIAPSLSYVPELAMDTLEQLINTYDEHITLIGSSLGGFYSIYLAEKYGLKAVLINPAVDSSKTLKRVLSIGETAKNYYDDSRFTWSEEHVDMLINYRSSSIKNGRYFLLLQKDDDVLDYREALAKLPNAKSIVEEGGSHPFEHIERHFEEIKTFINTSMV
ncbi:MAG: Putative esterase, FIGfam005057 [uncultured Sulfurovum sp.]|uniref:Esterase, FIGfam005057 n=1 Tax=uncultured Sulfurovum sp. TaxID=269237 RepID=A0A6S6T0Z0_9BACT|nr:MAG: Putative esterase, FIGfam005057 [uncultured Sulfurovum sp.]